MNILTSTCIALLKVILKLKWWRGHEANGSVLGFQCPNVLHFWNRLWICWSREDTNQTEPYLITDVRMYCTFESILKLSWSRGHEANGVVLDYRWTHVLHFWNWFLKLSMSRGHEANGCVLDYRCSHELYFWIDFEIEVIERTRSKRSRPWLPMSTCTALLNRFWERNCWTKQSFFTLTILAMSALMMMSSLTLR